MSIDAHCILRRRAVAHQSSLVLARAAKPLLRTAGATVLLTWFIAGPLAAQAPDNPLRRLQYLEQPRAFPFDRVPPGALQRAKRDLFGRFPALVAGDRGAARAADGETWIGLGPENIDRTDAGRVSTIAIDPRDGNIMYAGGAQGGVWKTFDGGVSWQPLTDGQCSLAMGHIALDPANPDIVYAGTGEMHFSLDSYYGCGLLRSLDGGMSWETLGVDVFDTPAGGTRISRVLIDPATAGSAFTTTVFVATTFGLYRSTDSGTTWLRVLPGVATDLVRSPTNPQVLYVAMGAPAGAVTNGIFRSVDGGALWTPLAGGLPTAEVGRIALAIAPSSPGTLYAAISDAFAGAGGDGDLLGIWRTDDGGATWSELTATRANCATQCWYDLAISVHPTDPERVYFGGVFLYRSFDGGATFIDATNGIHVDQHDIVFHPSDPNTIVVGNDGGVYRSVNGGTTWQILNTNLAITQFYPGVSMHPTDRDQLLGGTQDNGTLVYAGDPVWTRVLGADGGYTAMDPIDPSVTYAETQWTPGSQFSGPRRRDGIGAYERKVLGIDTNDRALFIPPMVLDGARPAVLYFGTYRLYRTNDRAESWQPISGDLSKGMGSISAVAPALGDAQTIYVGTSDGNVVVTHDLGTTWVPATGLPTRYVRDFDVSRTDPLDAVVVFSGFGTAHVFRTTDGGVTWTDISGDLPDVPVNAVLRHPNLGQRLLIGTDLGPLQSVDGGVSWQPYGDGIPNVAVLDLVYGATTGRILAATHGRGTFAIDIDPALNVVVMPDSIRFAALGDTVRLEVQVTDLAGTPVDDAVVEFRSTMPDVAVVDASGLVRSVGNGMTDIIATIAAAADTAHVVVAQVAAAIAGLPTMARLVVDESVAVEVQVVDSLGSPVSGVTPVLRTDDPTVLAIDGDRIVALREGAAFLFAEVDGLRDSVRVSVESPATLRLGARDGAPELASARTGTRVPLLALTADVDGIEDVRLTRLAVDVTGGDAGRLLLVRDIDGNGEADPDDPVAGSAPIPEGAGSVIIETNLTVPADTVLSLLIVAEITGGARNGTLVSARLDPEGTRTLNARSMRADRVVQPDGAVVSSVVELTVLGAGELLSFSENPVRSGRVIFNFARRPRTAAVYTLNGRRIADLMPGVQDARAEWDLTNDAGGRVAPGVYLVVFEIDGQVLREKLIVAGPDDAEPAQPSARRSSVR